MSGPTLTKTTLTQTTLTQTTMTETGAPLRRPLQRQAAADRLAAGSSLRRRPPPTARRIARRRLVVALTKWALPLCALLLLGAIAAWPEISRISDGSRISFRRGLQLEPESGQMRDPRYHGLDQRGRPYTVTASSAQQTTPERLALVDPKGDMVTESGTWLMGQSKDGVYMQHLSLLDLSTDVTLYREDGTTLQTDTAAMDLKQGAATGSDKTHVEGPFGTIDAQGFALVDKGAVIQFDGRSHAILNAAEKAVAPTPAPTMADNRK